MALQTFNFAGLPTESTGLADVLGNVLQGYKMQREPTRIAQEEEHRNLQNAMDAIRKQFMPQEHQAQLAAHGRAAKKFEQEQQDRAYLDKILGMGGEGSEAPGFGEMPADYEPGKGQAPFSPEAARAALEERKKAGQPNLQALESNPLARALFKHRYGFDPVKQELSFIGPAREAMDLERLRKQVGEESPVYQNALKTFEGKQQGRQDLSETRKARLEGLGSGETWLRNEEGDIVGKQTKVSPQDKKEYKGRGYFGYVYGPMAEGLSHYSGQGSWSNFLADVNEYGTNPEARQKIDDYLLGKLLATSTAVKENATLGGSNTFGMFNQIKQSIDSSDIPKKAESVVKAVGLPNEAMQKANKRFEKVIKDATKAGELAVPAFNKQYFEPKESGQTYKDRLDESVEDNDPLIDDKFRKMSLNELLAIAHGE